jgi:hypothetical protein
MTTRHGISRTTASKRGLTRKRSGPIPIASIASTSSATVIVPKLGRVGSADPRRHHDAGHERSEFSCKSDCHERGDEAFLPKVASW